MSDDGDIVLDTTNLDVVDSGGFTALHNAASAGDVAAVQALLRKGARVDPHSTSTCTPLFSACMNANHTDSCVDVARILLKHKANPNGTPEARPLVIATGCWRHPELMALLLDEGADPNLTQSGWIVEGLTPLYAASAELIDAGGDFAQQSEGLLAITTALLKHGANPNAQCSDGATPLHKLCELDNREDDSRPRDRHSVRMAALLVAAGARLDVRDTCARTPIDIFTPSTPRTNALRRFLKNPKSPPSPMPEGGGAQLPLTSKPAPAQALPEFAKPKENAVKKWWRFWQCGMPGTKRGVSDFEYKAIDAKGNELAGTIEAVGQNQAISQLREKGLFPTSVTQVRRNMRQRPE